MNLDDFQDVTLAAATASFLEDAVRMMEPDDDLAATLLSLARSIRDRLPPEEPTGLGAVVRDDDGELWARADLSHTPWRLARRWVWSGWGKELIVSTKAQILSRGVEVES